MWNANLPDSDGVTSDFGGKLAKISSFLCDTWGFLLAKLLVSLDEKIKRWIVSMAQQYFQIMGSLLTYWWLYA